MLHLNTSTQDFKQLVLSNDIFIDKSLFINEIFNTASSVLLITMPRRWGKSINLDMLRRFLTNVDDDGKVIAYEERTKTDNYKLFMGGKVKLKKDKYSFIDKYHTISQSNLIKHDTVYEKGQGIFPVIYIDFKTCTGSSKEEIIKKLKESFLTCFMQHQYLYQSDKLSLYEKNKINAYLDESIDALKLDSGLYFLSSMLHKHYGKKVWMLIDEYDAVLNAIYFNNELDPVESSAIIEFFKRLYSAAVKGNIHLNKAVITGILNIAQSSLGSGFNNAYNYNVTDYEYSQYYGLDQKEVDDLTNAFQLTASQRQGIKDWYNGYQLMIYEKEKTNIVNKYNVYSIVNYLSQNNKPFRSYWKKSASDDFIKKLLKHDEINTYLQQLVQFSKEGEVIGLYGMLEDNFGTSHFESLRDIVNLGNAAQYVDIDIVFSYLFFTGYLTIDALGKFVIPNREIRHHFLSLLTKHYTQRFRLNPNKLMAFTMLIQSLFTSSDFEKTISTKLATEFEDLLNAINTKEGVVYSNEDVFHTILNNLCLMTVNTHFGTELYTKKIIDSAETEQKGRADIMLKNKQRGILIELKHQGSCEEALAQAKSYGNLLSDVAQQIFIGINVAKNKKVTLDYEISSH